MEAGPAVAGDQVALGRLEQDDGLAGRRLHGQAVSGLAGGMVDQDDAGIRLNPSARGFNLVHGRGADKGIGADHGDSVSGQGGAADRIGRRLEVSFEQKPGTGPVGPIRHRHRPLHGGGQS